MDAWYAGDFPFEERLRAAEQETAQRNHWAAVRARRRQQQAWLASGGEEAVLVEVAGGSLSTATLDAPPTTACWPLAVVAIAMRGCVGLPKICNAALCANTEVLYYNFD